MNIVTNAWRPSGQMPPVHGQRTVDTINGMITYYGELVNASIGDYFMILKCHKPKQEVDPTFKLLSTFIIFGPFRRCNFLCRLLRHLEDPIPLAFCVICQLSFPIVPGQHSRLAGRSPLRVSAFVTFIC